MLFNSLPFLIFAIVFFAFWPFLNKKKNARYSGIVLFSFLFYGWWDWRFLFLILFSGIIDYLAGLLIYSNQKRKKLYLAISLVANVGSLAIFKYAGLLAESLDSILSLASINIGLQNNLPEFTLILPVGISFYTFQSMSYTIDIYRNQLKPTKNIFHFFAFLAMFPQLVAGPIIRAKNLLKQLEEYKETTSLQTWNGLKLITYGYFQKTVIADNVAMLVNPAFKGVGGNDSMIYWWIVMICFSLQIYFDFSGYSSIARGLAKLMGYHFKMNFNHPYISTSLKEFWQRWHISLSTWFRDYVYFALGGSKKSKLRSHVNMWITMTISGLWHGAAFTFIFWGLIHSLFLSIERASNWTRKISTFPGGKTICWVIVMVQVIIAWTFFRAETMQQAFGIINRLFSTTTTLIVTSQFFNALTFLLIGLLFEIMYFLQLKNKHFRKAFKNIWAEAITIALLVTMSIFFRGPEQEFIYFQF
jgi:D-alanyl-lipoteichoic acid acyltransferase DltB (MBOAT superfamily)